MTIEFFLCCVYATCTVSLWYEIPNWNKEAEENCKVGGGIFACDQGGQV